MSTISAHSNERDVQYKEDSDEDEIAFEEDNSELEDAPLPPAPIRKPRAVAKKRAVKQPKQALVATKQVRMRSAKKSTKKTPVAPHDSGDDDDEEVSNTITAPKAKKPAKPKVTIAMVTAATMDGPVFTAGEVTMLGRLYSENSLGLSLTAPHEQSLKTTFYLALEDVGLCVAEKIGQVCNVAVNNITYFLDNREAELAKMSAVDTAAAEAYILAMAFAGHVNAYNAALIPAFKDERALGGDVTLAKQMALEFKRIVGCIWSRVEVKFSNLNPIYYRHTTLQGNTLLAEQVSNAEKHQYTLMALLMLEQQSIILNVVKDVLHSAGRSVEHVTSDGLFVKKRPGETSLPAKLLRDATAKVLEQLDYDIKLVAKPQP